MKCSRKNPQLPISVLNLPPRNSFVQIPSPSQDYNLYQVEGKKICIEAYKIQVQKTKLFTNLEIYQWRNQTQFPIVKTKYVSIQPSHMQSFCSIELVVFNEHCPLKLNAIDQMTIGQCLYMLKEVLIGFERLYNRFGSFVITQKMIGVNEKGLCRVWVNENFSLNFIHQSELNEQRMVACIFEIIQKHCQQSKSIRKLFAKLRICKTFLSSLKQIDSFIMAQKALVSSRYSISSLKQIPSYNSFERVQKKQSISQQNIRCSIKSSRVVKDKTKIETVEIENQNHKVVNQIKRFKSEDKIRVENLMKVSDGETAYTRNIKCSNTAYYSSPREAQNDRNVQQSLKVEPSKWLEELSFVMDEDTRQYKAEKKDKKQLSYSQAVIGLNNPKQLQQNGKNRKLSINVHPLNSYIYKFSGTGKKSQYDAYAEQFNSILQDNCSSSPKILEDDEQDKCREEHTVNIMKNNGWNSFTGFMDLPQDMNQSFHQGQDQNMPKKEFKLEKLDSIGKRPVAMSILPQQYEDII